MLLNNQIEQELGHDLNEYLRTHNSRAYASLRTAFRDRQQKKTAHTDDYSAILQQICRCYEALMKTLFINAGLDKKKYVLNYMYYNKRSQAYCLDNKYLNMNTTTRYDLGTLYSDAYGKYRNDVSHGGPPDAHFVVTSYEKANTWFGRVVQSMVGSFEIMKSYVSR